MHIHETRQERGVAQVYRGPIARRMDETPFDGRDSVAIDDDRDVSRSRAACHVNQAACMDCRLLRAYLSAGGYGKNKKGTDTA
jgi:hypothetical protein